MAVFILSLNLALSISRSNTPPLSMMTDVGLGLLAVVCNYGPNYQLPLLWQDAVVTDGPESQTQASNPKGLKNTTDSRGPFINPNSANNICTKIISILVQRFLCFECMLIVMFIG